MDTIDRPAPIEGALRAALADLVSAGPDPSERDLPVPGAPSPRRGPIERRTLVAALALVCLVSGGAVLHLAASSGGTESLTSQSPTTTPDVPTPKTTPPLIPGIVSTTLGGPSGAPGGSIRSAGSNAEFEQLWADAGVPRKLLPAVDFGKQTIVAFTFADAGCPSNDLRFSSDRRSIEVSLMEPDTCSDPLRYTVPKTFMVAFDWAQTGRPFEVSMPADPSEDVGAASLRVG